MSKAKLIFKSKAKRPVQTKPEEEQPAKQQQKQRAAQNQQNKFKDNATESTKQQQNEKQQKVQRQKFQILQKPINEKEQSFNKQIPKITQIQSVQQQRLRRNLLQIKKRKLQQIMESIKKEDNSQNKLISNSNQPDKQEVQAKQINDELNDVNSKICKHKGKHYKIYNEEHFKDTQQIKISTHRWEYGDGYTPDKIMIASWNLNGIRARFNNSDIQPYVGNVSPDIFCVNQHKMDQKSYDELLIKFPGYFSYWNFSKISLAYSGVAIFSKYAAISMIEDMPQQKKQFNMQGRVMTLEFQKFVLVNAYIPTSGKQLQRLHYRTKVWDPVFTKFITGLKQKFKHKILIVCGDLNVSHQQIDCHTGVRMRQNRQPSYTPAERSNFSKLLQTGFIDTFRALHPNQRAYTWWNLRRGGRHRVGQLGIGKRLDYFLITKQHFSKVIKSTIQKEWKGNDHCPIQLQINFGTKPDILKMEQIIVTQKQGQLHKQCQKQNNQ